MKRRACADAGFGKQVQVGRLLELDGQRLLQGSVENGIAGGVDEVGEDDGVFFGERVGAAGAKEQASADQGCDQQPRRDRRESSTISSAAAGDGASPLAGVTAADELRRQNCR